MVESAIKAVEGSGHNPVASPRANPPADLRPARDESETEAAQKQKSQAAEREKKVHAVPAVVANVNLSTRVTLDSKTFQVYIQTVADQPHEPVIHSYPPPPESIDPNRLIVLA